MFHLSNKVESEQKIQRTLNIAKLFFQNKDYETAKEYINELLETNPDLIEAYKILSQINEALGQNEMAIQNYQKFLDLKSMESNDNFKEHFYSPSKLITTSRAKKIGPNQFQNSPSRIEDSDLLKNIEALIDSKFMTLNNSIQFIKNHFENLISISNKNHQEISVLKQTFEDLNKKIVIIANKQQGFENFFSKRDKSLRSDLEKMTQSIGKISTDISNFFSDTNEKFDSLFNCIREINNEEEDEEDEEDEDDYKDYDSPSAPNVLRNTIPLIELCKRPNTWCCESCSVYNENNNSKCLSCENPRYSINQQKNQNNFISSQNSSFATNQFKFPDFNNLSTNNSGDSNRSMMNNSIPSFSSNPTSISTTSNVPTTTNNMFIFGKLSANSPVRFSNPFSKNIENQKPSKTPNSTLFSPPKDGLLTDKNAQLNLSNVEDNKNISKPFVFGISESINFIENLSKNQGFSVSNENLESSDNKKKEKKYEKLQENDVEIIYVKQPKSEHLKMIKILKLPPNFYDYEEKPLCKGCIGCRVDEISWNDLTKFELEDENQQSTLGFFSQFPNIPTDTIDNIKINKDNVELKSFTSEKIKLLPQNYKHLTGEENEEMIYQERAKLYRLDKIDNVYKDRGVGEIKILKKRNEVCYRLLMRRDKVFNVICNHLLNPKLKFNKKKNCFSWATIDFSESPEGTNEVFLIKFKDEQNQQSFFEKVQECIENLKNN